MYEELFARFTENYWDLVVKYNLRQMKSDGKLVFSKMETILKAEVVENALLTIFESEAIEKESEDNH